MGPGSVRGWGTKIPQTAAVWPMCVCVCLCVLYIFMHAQSCLTLCDLIGCSPPGSSVHGVFLEGILGWVAIYSSRKSSPPRDRTPISCSSCIVKWILHTEPSGKPGYIYINFKSCSIVICFFLWCFESPEKGNFYESVLQQCIDQLLHHFCLPIVISVTHHNLLIYIFNNPGQLSEHKIS